MKFKRNSKENNVACLKSFVNIQACVRFLWKNIYLQNRFEHKVEGQIKRPITKPWRKKQTEESNTVWALVALR